MGEKIVVGPITKGLTTGVTPFVIDNDAFPTLINAYQWRGRLKRKRGTAKLGRLTRYFDSSIASYTSTPTVTLNGSGVKNLVTGFSLETNTSIIPGSVTITAPGPTLYTDPAEDGTLSPSGSINYATGVVTIAAQANQAVSAKFRYYPSLPVMGLEEFQNTASQFPETLGFDTKYSYNITTFQPYEIYNTSFYKNPSNGTYTGYTKKTVYTETTWNGDDYQQFYTVNYQGALWATNGIDLPFVGTNIGMQFKNITGIAIVAAGPPATADITIVGHGLSVGDFVFINEVGGLTGINYQTGYVIDATNPNIVRVEFQNATLGAAYTTGGIAQYLTNRSDTTKDCLRWYDGDPTDGNVTTPSLTGAKGWVNFAPPLSNLNYSIADLPDDQYYLVGARIITPFKDRLLFIGPVIQSSDGNPIYLQDTIIFSQNGTPYYTCSFTGEPNSATTDFTEILVPRNQTATPTAYWEDSSGYGGFISIALDQKINTASFNGDVLVLGMDNTQVKVVYTGNDILPFEFYIVNSELGSSSTQTAINLDKGVITRGDRGYIVTTQTEADRIDLQIPDEVFECRLSDNGTERFCAQRDYINEWIYFTYPANQTTYRFPNRTLQYNYREATWAIFNECYTTYGQFKKRTGYTWSTIGTVFPSWALWNEPWEAGSSTILQPEVIAGNQQGFVVFRDEGTGETPSLQIQNVSVATITSTDHTLNNGDYIVINDCLGTVSSQLNGKVFRVQLAADNAFVIAPTGTNPTITAGTYLGGGTITRIYSPYIQSKQFPASWGYSRKTRIGNQQYLLSTTSSSQIALLIFLSQNGNDPYNDGPIVPSTNVQNESLIYSTVLYTCPESTNLGLTPANSNLQMPTATQQQQIWHRINTSLIGDTIQVGFTLSKEQLEDANLVNQFAEIELHGFILDVSPSQILA